jgi:hypothetical protein
MMMMMMAMTGSLVQWAGTAVEDPRVDPEEDWAVLVEDRDIKHHEVDQEACPDRP